MKSLPVYHEYMETISAETRAGLIWDFLTYKYRDFDPNDYLALGIADPAQQANADKSLTGQHAFAALMNEAEEYMAAREEGTKKFLGFVANLFEFHPPNEDSLNLDAPLQQKIDEIEFHGEVIPGLVNMLESIQISSLKKDLSHAILGKRNTAKVQLEELFPDANVERILRDLEEIFPSFTKHPLFETPKPKKSFVPDDYQI